MLHDSDLFPSIIKRDRNAGQAMGHGIEGSKFMGFRAEGIPRYQYIGGSSFPEFTKFMVPIFDGNV